MLHVNRLLLEEYVCRIGCWDVKVDAKKCFRFVLLGNVKSLIKHQSITLSGIFNLQGYFISQ